MFCEADAVEKGAPFTVEVDDEPGAAAVEDLGVLAADVFMEKAEVRFFEAADGARAVSIYREIDGRWAIGGEKRDLDRRISHA